jgi:hypothetical protein
MTAGEIPEQLALETRKLGEAYTTAAAELERLLEVEARIPHLSPVKTIQLPALPSAPVSSGGGLNLVLVGTLAAFLVISAVLLREWYGGTPPASTPRRLGTLDGASQDAAEEQPAGEHARVPAPVN